KKSVLKAYSWICENHKPGDKIFLFGFSRGAYEVRTLAAMIDEVGQIQPRKVQVRDSTGSGVKFDIPIYSSENAVKKAGIFKTTFARSIKIHFVGVWDTLASPGILGKLYSLPSSAECVCIFRHALALDESRLKFLSAIRPPQPPQPVEIREKEIEEASRISGVTKRPTSVSKLFPGIVETRPISETTVNVPDIKEVWFPGTHIDMGGGSKSNAVLSSVPLLWMENEAASAGLRLRSRKSGGKWMKEELREAWGVREPSLSPLRDSQKPSSRPLRRWLDFSSIKPAWDNFSATWYGAAVSVRIYPDFVFEGRRRLRKAV
ncbi:hypothetical protein K438DRAFT_1640204, partial [Mycena galopus ATCC 62051]